MTEKTEDILEKTDLKTLWTDTLFELLHDALKNNWSNNALRQIFKELKSKGYKPEKVIQNVKKRYGDDVAEKLYKKIKKN
jgi:hypothetical protein